LNFFHGLLLGLRGLWGVVKHLFVLYAASSGGFGGGAGFLLFPKVGDFVRCQWGGGRHRELINHPSGDRWFFLRGFSSRRRRGRRQRVEGPAALSFGEDQGGFEGHPSGLGPPGRVESVNDVRSGRRRGRWHKIAASARFTIHGLPPAGGVVALDVSGRGLGRRVPGLLSRFEAGPVLEVAWGHARH
jgi:hypothetical protein